MRIAVVMRIGVCGRVSYRRMAVRFVQMARRRWFGWRRQAALLAQILPRRHLVVVFITAAVEMRDKSLTRFLVHVAEQGDVRVLEA
jgi:hypothetical protein